MKQRGSLSRRLRFLLRACLAPGSTGIWIRSLIDGPMRSTALRVPRLFEKPQRLYLNRHWNAARRHQVLLEHYDWLCHAFSPAQIDALYGETGLIIAILPDSMSQSVSVSLRYDAGFEREGELALSLRLGARGVLGLAFTIGRDTVGRRQLMIGSLQSKDSGDALDIARELTHALHGLRPKALLTMMAQAVAAASGMSRVLAVADEAHVFRGWRYLLKRNLIGRHRVFACYDTLWTECGGEARQDGFYELPSQAVRRDPATVKANKRAMYRRRYAMLDAVERQLRELPIDWAAGGVVISPFTLPTAPLSLATTGAPSPA